MKNRVIRVSELQEVLGLSKVTIWRMERDGELPPRRKLTGRAVGWLSSDIDEWLENRPTADVYRKERFESAEQ